MDLTIFQEHREWTAREFGGQPVWHGVMGAMEELGELIDAQEPAAVADAVADASLFLIGSMNAAGLSFPEGWAPTTLALNSISLDRVITVLTTRLGTLARCVLKMDQQRLFGVEPRYKDRDWNAELLTAYLRTFDCLCTIAELCKYDYHGLVRDTWNEVKQRTKYAQPDAVGRCVHGDGACDRQAQQGSVDAGRCGDSGST